ncbi:MAG: UbiD family decarboxylase [Methanomicrobiales archaeon]|jgi:UbiD family decarboxylase|nr:UbiD family decarboxylase [Methanomicrobiales archaeon]
MDSDTSTFRGFLKLMEEKGRVTHIPEPFSSEYEVPKRSVETDEILLFESVDDANGGKHRVVMNLLATRASLADAVMVSEEDLVSHLAGCSYQGEIREGEPLVCGKVDLDALPIMRHFPGDAGRYITAGVVFSEYGGALNASVHRMLVDGKERLIARLVEGRHTHSLLSSALKAGERLPVAVAIGLHPLVLYAACSRVPLGKELSFAAELLGGTITVRALSNGVRVPDAEIILEGFIGPELFSEGPFVDITGTYDPIRMQHGIELTGMWMKEDPIYHGIVPAGSEHKLLMGAPYEPLIYRSVAQVTEVVDVVLTRGGAGYLHAVVQIKKRTDGDGKNAIMATFAAHTSLKHVVIVDPDIMIHDPHDVEFAIATRVRADQDLMIISGVRGSSLDPSRIGDGLNAKMGIDATMPLGKEEEFVRVDFLEKI